MARHLSYSLSLTVKGAKKADFKNVNFLKICLVQLSHAHWSCVSYSVT